MFEKFLHKLIYLFSNKNTYIKGIFYEKIASNYLKKQGYKIILKNYKNKLGEIDIIVEKNNTLIAVEVKFRQDNNMLMYAISKKQQERILRSLQYFLKSLKGRKYKNYKVRIDAIFINNEGLVNHIDNAWGQ